MDKVVDYLSSHDESSITEIADDTGIDRHVVSKELHRLEAQGTVSKRSHGPSTKWSLTGSPLITKLQQEDRLSDEIKTLLEELPATISVHDEHGRISWSTTEGEGHRRSCHLFHRGRTEQCKDCPIDAVRRTGNPASFTTTWDGDEQTITLIPITDSENETQGVIEHIA